MTTITLPSRDVTMSNHLSDFFLQREMDPIILQALQRGQPVQFMNKGAARPFLQTEPTSSKDGLVFTLLDTGDAWTMDSKTEDQPEVWSTACSEVSTIAMFLAYLPATLPAYTATLDPKGVLVARNGQPYAILSLLHTKESWSSSTGLSWRGPINGKAWNTPLRGAKDIMRALVKREKINEPIYGFRDATSGLYYGGHDWGTRSLSFVPKRTKARTFKRRADASGHASWLAGVGSDSRPTAPGWEEAYKEADYGMHDRLDYPCPLPATYDLISIDKGTGEETVCETAQEIEARVARRLALQRNVVARYGYGSTAAIDAAEKAERTDLDTLVLVYDASGAVDVRAALKAAGVAGKKSLARKATYDSYHHTTLVTWSLAVPASAVAAVLAALPDTVLANAVPFADATRP